MILNDLEIVDVKRKIPLGVTNPYLVKCSNGKSYIAKFPGNPDGTKVLINEYICAELAKLLKLPVPNYELINVPNIFQFKNILTDIDMISGTVFCSEWLEKSTKLPDYQILTKIDNKYDPIKILIFDVIIENNDRNEGNLLINLKNKTLVMIDHSHVFIKEALWNAKNLKELANEDFDLSKMNKITFDNLLLCLNDRNYVSTINEYVNEIKNISSENLDYILSKIPNDWKITVEEKESVKLFLLNRFKRVDKVCKLLGIEKGD